MSTVAIVTANYGGFDEPRPQPLQDLDVDWIYVSDSDHQPPTPWVLVRRDPAFEHPCLAAKVPKMLPWTILPHERVIWIDANMEITNPRFAREVLAVAHDEIAAWQHPRRDCIYTEAEASVGAESQGGKYDGLYACGTIAWDVTSPQARELGAMWLAECERWSFQDQLSLPVVCRRLGIVPSVFAVRQIERARRRYLENRWLRIHPHLQPV